MKRFLPYLLLLLTALAFPAFASADVAGVGTIIVFGLLPYVLIAAVIVIAIVVIVKCLKNRNNKK